MRGEEEMGLWNNIKKFVGKIQERSTEELKLAMIKLEPQNLNSAINNCQSDIIFEFNNNTLEKHSSLFNTTTRGEIQEKCWNAFENNREKISKRFNPIISAAQKVLKNLYNAKALERLDEVVRKAEELKNYNNLAQHLTDVIICHGSNCSPKEDPSWITEKHLEKFAEFCQTPESFAQIEQARKILSLPESPKLKAMIEEADRERQTNNTVVEKWVIPMTDKSFKNSQQIRLHKAEPHR